MRTPSLRVKLAFRFMLPSIINVTDTKNVCRLSLTLQTRKSRIYRNGSKSSYHSPGYDQMPNPWNVAPVSWQATTWLTAAQNKFSNNLSQFFNSHVTGTCTSAWYLRQGDERNQIFFVHSRLACDEERTSSQSSECLGTAGKICSYANHELCYHTKLAKREHLMRQPSWK